MSKVVYVHRRNDDNSIFYVGMGSKERPYSSYRRSKEWNSVACNGYYIEIVKFGLSKKNALEIESKLIQSIGLNKLTNKTVGGQGGSVHYNNKDVYQYNLEGDLLCVYNSIAKASRISNVTRQNISKCLNGKRKHAGGFLWSLNKEIKKPVSITKNANRYVLDTSTGVFYNSVHEYCDLNKLNPTTVWRWLTGKRENKTNLKYV